MDLFEYLPKYKDKYSVVGKLRYGAASTVRLCRD
jgi:hypothetical protein